MLRRLAVTDDDQDASNDSCTMVKSLSRDRRIGIRRVARACSRSFAYWNDNGNTSDHPCSDAKILSMPSSYEQSFKKLELLEKQHQQDQERLDQEMRAGFNTTHDEYDKTTKHKISKTLRKSRPSLENVMVSTIAKSLEQSSALHRVVVIRNHSLGTGLACILSQVHGGPLERVIYHNQRLELYFLLPEQANRFFQYGTQTGLFIVNGQSLNLEWATNKNTEDVGSIHPVIQKSLLHEIVQHGLRRSLIFAQTIVGKPMRSDKKLFYPDPLVHFSLGINAVRIKNDFSAFGQVQCMMPVISRKLCFSLVFTDVRLAIIAKRECETVGTSMNSLYGQWTIWFGKDGTDTPCLLV